MNAPASDLAERHVSRYLNVRDTAGKPIALTEILDAIKSGYWEKEIAAIRAADAANDEKTVERLKESLQGFTASGVFSPKRKKDKIFQPSGLLIVDIDDLQNLSAAESMRDRLADDPHVLAAFVSPSGRGTKAIVYAGNVPNDAAFKSAWRAWASYARERYSLDLDPSGKDICRLCFVSHDSGLRLKDAPVEAFAARMEAPTLKAGTKAAPDGEIKRAKAEVATSADPDSLDAQFGPPYFMRKTEKGKFAYAGLNEGHLAGLHASRNVELWEPNEKAFFRYCAETGLFAEVTADLLKQEVSKLILDMGNAKRVKGLVMDRNAPRLTAIVQQLKGIVEQRDAFKKNGRFLHLANGVLDLSGDAPVLLPFSPDFRSRNASPIAYDPSATCPRFLDALLLPAVHPEDVAVIQKYMGLSLLGRNIIQRLLILDGMAGRGKSQLAIVIQHLVGMVNCTQLRTEHLNERFELYRFLRKTLLAGVDVQADFLSARGAPVLKALVGGDIMDAEQKGGTGCFPIEGTFNVVITCNSRLRVRLEGDVGAWRRRLLIVRYEAPPPAKKIPDFGAHLVKTEGSGILNWAVEGLGDLLRDVEETGDIALTPRQAGVVDSLLAESDSLRQFLADRVERAVGDGNDLSVHEIVEAYAEYCPGHGWSPLPITVIQRQIEGLMLELFQTVKVQSIQRDGKAARGFRNVRFKVSP